MLSSLALLLLCVDNGDASEVDDVLDFVANSEMSLTALRRTDYVADEPVVSVKLEQIEQYHGELAEKQETLSRSEFLESATEQRAVERMFENAIQVCSDLANHIATQPGNGL